MNLWKRACLYSLRKKGKTVTLLSFLLVMATLMLTCLSIRSATETANANIKKALMGYFTINAKGAAQVPEGYENAGKIVANSNSQDDSYFTDGGFELTDGNPITTEGGNNVLVHEKFAQRNGLAVGGTMLLGNVTDGSHMISVTVAGIFTNTKVQDSIGIAPSYDLYDNIVFTDLATASFLLYGVEGETSAQYGDFYVNDPDELERIMAELQEIKGVD